MSKTFKVRIEYTADGQVEEFESNCLSVISVEEPQEGDKFPTTVLTGGDCTQRELYALIRALDKEKEVIAKEIFDRTLRSISEEGDA